MRLPRHHREPGPPDEGDVAYAVQSLDLALSSVLEAREALADIDDVEPPLLALDTALRTDPGHRRSRDRLDERLRTLRELVRPECVADVLAVEEGLDDIATTASGVGYGVGILVARGARRDDA